MKKKKQTKKVTARDWGVVSLIARSGGKGAHRSKKRPPRTTTKAALKKSLMRNDSHEAFFMFFPLVAEEQARYLKVHEYKPATTSNNKN